MTLQELYDKLGKVVSPEDFLDFCYVPVTPKNFTIGSLPFWWIEFLADDTEFWGIVVPLKNGNLHTITFMRHHAGNAWDALFTTIYSQYETGWLVPSASEIYDVLNKQATGTKVTLEDYKRALRILGYSDRDYLESDDIWAALDELQAKLLGEVRNQLSTQAQQGTPQQTSATPSSSSLAIDVANVNDLPSVMRRQGGLVKYQAPNGSVYIGQVFVVEYDSTHHKERVQSNDGQHGVLYSRWSSNPNNRPVGGIYIIPTRFVTYGNNCYGVPNSLDYNSYRVK